MREACFTALQSSTVSRSDYIASLAHTTFKFGHQDIAKILWFPHNWHVFTPHKQGNNRL